MYFHKFENRGRHTVHSHVLVWIEELENILLERIKATVPLENTALAHLLINLLSKNNIPFYTISRIFRGKISFW